MDEHRFQAMGTERVQFGVKPERGEEARPGRIYVLGARLVTRKAGLVEDEDMVAAGREERRRETASRAAADDDDLGIMSRHVSYRI